MKIQEILESQEYPETPVYYLAYGMLTDPEIMRGLKLVGVGELRNFELKMYSWANVETSPGKSVYGCLWEIDRRVISELDKAEGYPSLYDRRTYPVYLDGKKYAAEVYVMTPQTVEEHQETSPSQRYVNRIVRGYKNAGVPLSQLSRALKVSGVRQRAQKIHNDPSPWADEITEAPLPPDWDPAEFKQGATSFRSRLAYALERAKRLGTGSSRVAMTIEYQGRQTALKIAKNRKGLAQNAAEIGILDDGYASQLGILIPMIDYDKENADPLWLQTELATKATEKQLCALLHVTSLYELVWLGKATGMGNRTIIDNTVNKLRQMGKDEEEIEVAIEYANSMAELANSFEVNLNDFARAANWGIYKGRPVIIDVGFTDAVARTHYTR